MRWRSGCEMRGKISSLILYVLESTHVHNLQTTTLLAAPNPDLVTSIRLLPSLSLHIQRQRTIRESYKLPQIISSSAPPRRTIHARSLLLGWLFKPNKSSNPPYHIPLSLTRPVEHNHHIVVLDPAPGLGELVLYYTSGSWERFCRWVSVDVVVVLVEKWMNAAAGVASVALSMDKCSDAIMRRSGRSALKRIR